MVAQKAVEAYDWNQKKWTSINLGQSSAPAQTPDMMKQAPDIQYQSMVLANPSSYINEDRVVRLRVTVGGGNPSCYYVDLGLQAEKLAGQGG
jgi:hypothetical protein